MDETWQFLKQFGVNPLFFGGSSYNPAPAPPAPTDAETQAAAEEAAAKERADLKKKKRPTLLTGLGGVTSDANLYKPQLTSSQGGNSTLG